MTGFPPSVSRALYESSRSRSRTRRICSDYARYEAEKLIWTCAHPGATPAEYEAAMRAIAKACGV